MIKSTDILLSHANCPDGSGCAILFISAGGNRDNIYFAGASNPDVDKEIRKAINEHPGARIYCVDVSPTEEMANEIIKNGIDFVLIDHHKTAVPLAKFDFAIIETENQRCGSRMFYDYLIGEHDFLQPLHDLILLIDDRDRWINKHLQSAEVATLHGIIGQEDFIKRFVAQPVVSFGIGERYLLNIEARNLECTLQRKRTEIKIKDVNIRGNIYKFGYVVSEKYQSEIGNYLCNLPDLNIDVCIIVGAKKCSMRSAENCALDLSQLARLNGGGGHRAASGFNTPFDIIEEVHEQLMWE